MKQDYSDKYNIILSILLFTIPIICLNVSYYFISNIKIDWARKEQQNLALREAEILASESDFANYFASNFSKIFEEFKNDIKSGIINNSIFEKNFNNKVNKILCEPFPNNNSLYLFKIASGTHQTQILLSQGDKKTGNRALCKAIEQLYYINRGNNYNIEKGNKDKTFLKNLLGKFTDINIIAHEMRGFPTQINGVYKYSWFIWDYIVVDNEVYAGFFICDQMDNWKLAGYKNALNELKKRKKAIGAFLPLYKEYGEPVLQSPLDKSKIFLEWAKTITIQSEDDINHWLINSLPQGVKLGKYTAFTYLDRGASYISVVIVRTIKDFFFPKWLVFFDIFLLLLMFLFLYFGIVLNEWPKISLKNRFILSYILASILPISILLVTAYGYMLQFQKNTENQTFTEIETTLKSFEIQKFTRLKDYRERFTKTLNDEKLIEAIEEKGVKDKSVLEIVIDNFEKKESLPILGVKLIDNEGNGAIIRGSAQSDINIENYINIFVNSLANILKTEISDDKNNESVTSNNKSNMNENLIGKEVSNSIDLTDFYKRISIPIPLINGNSCTYLIYDFLRIKNKATYMISMFWDDKTDNEKLIKDSFNNYYEKNINSIYNFAAYKVEGQNVKFFNDNNSRFHGSQDFIKELPNLAKNAFLTKKTHYHFIDGNMTVVMPSLKYGNTVLVGWCKKDIINKNIILRLIFFIIIIFISIIIIIICASKSSILFLRPVAKFKDALDSVSTGDLNISFENAPQNEFGQLSNEYNVMIDALKEKERLSKLISEQAILALEKKSSGLLNDTEIFSGVALVSDIRNFTGMSENYEPTMITNLLNEHFAEMSKIISEYGGQIYKYIGDAIEAVFPENSDKNQSASERAFEVGCKMISRLAIINEKREKLNLFTYKIGVGLSYGTFTSGSVGSIETRLDYAILGEPLKKANKLESLSIQNPNFPLVVDKKIANDICSLGFTLSKIESKFGDHEAYTLIQIQDTASSELNSHFKPIKEAWQSINFHNLSNTEISKNLKKHNHDKIFILQPTPSRFDSFKSLFYNSFTIIFLSLLISIGFYIINSTSQNRLKTESDVECYRLFEELNSDEVLKSSFETVCINFSDEVRKALNSKSEEQSYKSVVNDIYNKYKNDGIEIPYFCGVFYHQDEKSFIDSMYKGFSYNIAYQICQYSTALKNTSSNDHKNDIARIIAGNLSNSDFFNSDYYRRSGSARIENEDVWLFLDKIYLDSQPIKQDPNMIAFIVFGIPKNYNTNILKYYTYLVNNRFLLALNKGDKWIYSKDFPEKEKGLLKKYTSSKCKIYFEKKLKINNEEWNIYLITKDLYGKYLNLVQYSLIVFVVTFFIVLCFNILFHKIVINYVKNISINLKLDVLASAFLPLLIVCFTSILYINEDINVKKTEKSNAINQSIDNIEIKELYYFPYFKYSIKKLAYSNELKKLMEELSFDKNNQFLLNQSIELLKRTRRKFNDDDSKYKDKTEGNLYLKHLNLYHLAIINNIDSVISEKMEKSSKGTINKYLSKVVATTFMSDNMNNSSQLDKSKLEGELITETLLGTIYSVFGSDTTIKVTNFPNNALFFNIGFGISALYVCPFPNIINPKYLIIAITQIQDVLLTYLCLNKNRNHSLDEYINARGEGDEIYTFFSRDNTIGERYFYFEKQDFNILKELLLASYFINSSFLPVSRKVNFYGGHFLEARAGKYNNNSIFIGLGSIKSVYKKAYSNLHKFALVIFISLVLVFFIANTIIADLIAPVEQLIAGARCASIGDFSYRTNFDRGEELSELCSSFNKMMKSLEEKQLMNRMVSKTALSVSANEKDIASKKIDAAILYITVPGFDDIMRNTSSYELFRKLKRQIATIADLVIKNGGDIDKIIGEKLLIAFHDNSKSIEELAISACKAAIEIERNNQLDYKVSIGINCGQVISGFLGVGNKRDFTIIGDPVNVAARIAVFAEKLDSERCMISDNLYSIISDSINVLEYGKVELKGKSQSLKVYKLI